MYVPSTSAEVLAEATPIVGEPGEALEASEHLRRVGAQIEAYRSRVRQGQSSLAENHGLAVATLSSMLTNRVEPLAVLLSSDALRGETVFRDYGQHVQLVHERARQVQQRTDEVLAVIRVCAEQIEHIQAQIGARVPCIWNEGAPLSMPEPGLKLHLEPEELRLRAQQLNESYAASWRLASLRWQDALSELEMLRQRWLALYQHRVDAERRFVSALHETRCGAQPRFTSGVTASAAAGNGVEPSILGVAYAPRHAAVESDSLRRAHPLLSELYRGSLSDLALSGKVPVRSVELWWAGLSAADRSTLVTEAPLVIGNLDGVPLLTRIEANAVSAKHFAELKEITDSERDYWQRIASGELRLAVADRDRNRLVEVFGEIGPETQRVITYLPGTGTRMASFYEGGPQQVAAHLEKRSAGTTVAFVYKDGRWMGWVGKHSNTSYGFLSGLGQQVEQFQREVVGRDEYLGPLPSIAITHSAGMTVLSGAEQAGARFDTVLSLGGAYTLDGWSPNPDTNYHHFQYDNDMINRIDGGRLDTPHELKLVFEQHIFGSEGRSEAESHSRIAQGPETNDLALEEMEKVIEGKL